MKGPTMKVLVVEDEARLLRNLAKALREEDYAVDTAADGEEGLYKAQNSDYDAIVLDVMLPRLDGWQVLQKLRKTKKTPVLFLTARDTLADRVRGLDGGGDDYLVKPFDLSELFARLRAIIRRAADRPSPEIAIGSVRIDTRARTVAVDGKVVPLTAKEYMILEYLAQHQGKVVSRTELYEHVFDERADTLSNLLDVHIFNIRRKMSCPLVETRRGHGYCIEK
jgi:two-component system, OmpR family, response regulator